MTTQPPALPQPRQGEIWFVKLPTDPPDKDPRPVVVVSLDARNRHPRAKTVMVVPLSTTLREFDSHVPLKPGETGLSAPSEAQGENVTVVDKTSIRPPRAGIQLRTLSRGTLKQIARAIVLGMGISPTELC